MRYEYKILQYFVGNIPQNTLVFRESNGNDVDIEEALNELGADGWELVSFSSFNEVSGTDDYTSTCLYVVCVLKKIRPQLGV